MVNYPFALLSGILGVYFIRTKDAKYGSYFLYMLLLGFIGTVATFVTVDVMEFEPYYTVSAVVWAVYGIRYYMQSKRLYDEWFCLSDKLIMGNSSGQSSDSQL